jgi:type IV secretion system protein VirB10
MANDDIQAGEAQSGDAQAQSVADQEIYSEKARGSFDLRSKRSGSGPKKSMFVIIGLVGLVGLAVLVGIWVMVYRHIAQNSSKVDETTVKSDAALQVDRPADDSMANAKQEMLRRQQEQALKEQRDREREERERQQGDQKKPPPAPSGAPVRDPAPAQGPQPLTAEQRKLAGGLVMTPMLQGVAASGATVSGAQPNDGQPKTPAQGNRDAGQTDGGGLGLASRTRGSLSNLSGTGFTPTMAVLAPKGKYLLAHNTYTRCALYSEIVTDHPGLIECHLTDPLYSADGSTVIAEAGDKLTGEQSIEMKPGQVQIFTTWTELETQSGVRARLDSLGAGPMGASGTEGWIDNHYKERFGGAVMLSFLQDALQAAANTTQKSSGSGGYTVNNSEQNVENMASKALENTINIPPTGHLNPGTVLTVIVARDIDFSMVFENR